MASDSAMGDDGPMVPTEMMKQLADELLDALVGSDERDLLALEFVAHGYLLFWPFFEKEVLPGRKPAVHDFGLAASGPPQVSSEGGEELQNGCVERVRAVEVRSVAGP